MCRNHLLGLLNTTTTSNSKPILLIPPPSPPLTLDDSAWYAQMAFESLNVPALSILPAPLASLFALNATTGLVLHVGYDTSEISVVVDSVIRYECCVTASVGMKHCYAAFEGLLRADQRLQASLRAAKGDVTPEEMAGLIKDVAETVWRECTGDEVEVPMAKGGSDTLVTGTANVDLEEETFDVAKK